MSANSPTKEWLKNQLLNYGIPLPASSAKKEEYQRLYDEQVAPQVKNSEFSSDDEAEANGNGLPENGDVKRSVDKIRDWIKGLKDQCLLDALKVSGKSPGPIVESTRDLYEKMLYDLVKEKDGFTSAVQKIIDYIRDDEEAAERWSDQTAELDSFIATGGSVESIAVANGNGSSENGYSDSDEEDLLLEEETASRASRSSRASSKRSTPVPRPVQITSPQTKPGGAIGLYRSTAETNISKFMRSETTTTTSSDVGSPFRSHSQPRGVTESYYYSSSAVGPSASASPNVSSMQRGDYQSYNRAPGTVNRNPKNVVGAVVKGPRQYAFMALKYVLLFLIIGLGPLFAYYMFEMYNNGGFASSGAGAESKDELDQLIDSINQEAP